MGSSARLPKPVLQKPPDCLDLWRELSGLQEEPLCGVLFLSTSSGLPRYDTIQHVSEEVDACCIQTCSAGASRLLMAAVFRGRCCSWLESGPEEKKRQKQDHRPRVCNLCQYSFPEQMQPRTLPTLSRLKLKSTGKPLILKCSRPDLRHSFPFSEQAVWCELV